MSTEKPDNESEVPPEEFFAGIISEFDQINKNIFEICKIYYHQPFNKNLKPIERLVEFSTTAWEAIVSTIMEDEDLDESAKAKALAVLLKDSDQQRVGLFEELIGEENIFARTIRKDKIEEKIKDDLEDDDFDLEEFTSLLLAQYSQYLHADIEQFIEYVDLTPKRRTVVMAKILSDHALDITKTTVAVTGGVVGGLLWYDRIKKK